MMGSRRPALAGLLLLSLCCAAAAQDGPARSSVSLTVRGIAGPVLKARPRRFLAVSVIVENGGAADASGRLRVYRTRGRGSPTPDQVLFYERQVELPAGSRRQETVYYHCQEQEPEHQLAVVYQPDDDSITPPAPTYPQVLVDAHEVRLRILALTSRSGDDAAGILRHAMVPGLREWLKPQVERADLSALPDHMAGYESCEAIVVSDLDPDALPAAAAGPLLDWVGAGGQLIVAWAGRPEQLERSPLARVLPVARRPGMPPSQRPLLPLRGLAAGPPIRDERVLVDQVDALPGSEVLAADAQGPLVVRGRHGAGFVTYVAFALDAAPLRRWEGTPALGGALLHFPGEDLLPANQVTEGPPLEEVLWSLSEAIETLNPPSALIVAPLLILYVLLVAPVNYKVLALKRRTVWAQVVAAAIALVFGLLFYGLGRVYKGSESLVTQVARIELAAAPGKSRVETMTGFFSTEQGLADGYGPEQAVVGPIAEQSTSREGRVLHDADKGARLEALTLDTWALRRFRSLRASELGHVEVQVRLNESRLIGTIENKSRLRLMTPMLLTHLGVITFEDLDPGQKREFGPSVPRTVADMDPRQLPLLRGLMQDGQGKYSPRFGHAGGLGFGDPYQGSNERRLLGILTTRLGRCLRTRDRLPALLVARTGEDPKGVALEGNARSVVQRGIALVEAGVDVGEGRVRLDGLPPCVTLASRDWRPVAGATGAPPQLGGIPTAAGTVEWTWQLPSSSEVPLQVDTLRVWWVTDPTVRFPKLCYLEGYSWVARDWIPLENPGGLDLSAVKELNGKSYWDAPGPRLNDLVDLPSGALRLRLLNIGSDLSIEHLSVDIQGRRLKVQKD